MRKFIADVHVYKIYFKGISKAKWRYVEQILLITLLRTSLCKNQTTWEMNNFNPPSNFACSWALCTLVAMVTTSACSRPGASFSYKNVAKKEWNVYLSISSYKQHYKLALLPYIVTSFVFTLIYSIFPESECEHTNRLFISVQFRSFLLSGKTGKTFIWISPKVHRFWNWNYPPSWL